MKDERFSLDEHDDKDSLRKKIEVVHPKWYSAIYRYGLASRICMWSRVFTLSSVVVVVSATWIGAELSRPDGISWAAIIYLGLFALLGWQGLMYSGRMMNQIYREIED